MFDEMSNVADSGHESYYSTASKYAKAIDLVMTVGNLWADVSPSFLGTVCTVLIYEHQGYPSSSYLDGWHSEYNK
jgi:hypothetical protein